MSEIQRPRRADAERNREAILDAAMRCLSVNPRASMAAIAAGAGVGRVTLYGHFSSRGEVIEAAFARAMTRAEASLSGLALDGEPFDALERLVLASWRIVDESRLVLQAAEEELGLDTVKRHHAESMERVRGLVRRGRRTGAFRKDLPADWLVTCYYAVLHGAAEEVRSGRLAQAGADQVVWRTIDALFRPPAKRAARGVDR
ncbi:TetR family transcriptional regulator [Actinopolymorpha sp. B9G3]|uniref:TetR/AcrR family transcriptional regulator n=1 Tax=Actinopolymorpha sp. B9G3 TaxID=3158970 RepID=UPI0032D8B79F